MLELDPFFQRIQTYTGTSHNVGPPDQVITLDQQLTFFDRCHELSPPLDLDTSALELRSSGQAQLTDEEIMFLTGLRAEDEYSIYGASVWLDVKEALDTDDRVARITTLRRKPSELGGVVMLLSRATYEVTAEGKKFYWPHFYESSRIMDKDLVAALAQVAAEFMEREGIEPIASLPERIEEPAPLIEIQEFTQVRWVEAMLLLDMVADLQYLGLQTTEDLNQA